MNWLYVSGHSRSLPELNIRNAMKKSTRSRIQSAMDLEGRCCPGGETGGHFLDGSWFLFDFFLLSAFVVMVFTQFVRYHLQDNQKPGICPLGIGFGKGWVFHFQFTELPFFSRGYNDGFLSLSVSFQALIHRCRPRKRTLHLQVRLNFGYIVQVSIPFHEVEAIPDDENIFYCETDIVKGYVNLPRPGLVQQGANTETPGTAFRECLN